MTTLFDDGVLEAILYPNQWVFCRWIQNTHGRLQKTLIRDLNRVEKLILENQFKGWYTISELTHSGFHKLLEKFGCKASEVEGEFRFFVKPIARKDDLHVRV